MHRTLHRFAVTLTLFASLGLLLGCGKSVEGQTKSWDANKLSLEKYAGKYPGLKTAINNHIAEAKKQYDSAQALTDEDAKAKALGLANAKLTQLITPFKSLDTAMADVGKMKKDPGVLKLSAAEVTPAVKLADDAVAKAKAMLDGQGVDTSGALVGKIEQAIATLKSGTTSLAALKAKVDAKAEKKAEKKAKKEAKKAAEAAKKDEAAKGDEGAAGGTDAPAAGTGTK